jgi:hypothetical protein
MGGSGGGDSFSQPPGDPEQLREEIRRELEEQELQAKLNIALGEYLAGVNGRDTDSVQKRLDQIQDAISDLAVQVDRLLFGGSVAKHTYVDGLSDVDALVIVQDEGASPADLVQRFAGALSGRLALGEVQEITAGRLAVTVTYRDGTQIQLLPAVERSGHTMIASDDGAVWRRIRPRKFAEKLTSVNKSNAGAVVPTIKLAKSLIQQLPADQQLSGYHVEAIAVDAFKGYNQRRDRMSMLKHLVEHAAHAVMRPTGDITGQSVHVDNWLGPAGSALRREVRASLFRLKSSLDSVRSVEELRALFND